MRFKKDDKVQVTLYKGANNIWVYPSEYYVNKNAEKLVLYRSIKETITGKGYKTYEGYNIPIYRENDYILLKD